MTIYELSDNYLTLLQMLEDDEQTDEFIHEAMADTLLAIDEAFEDKAENYAKIIRTLDADAYDLDGEIKRLTARRNAIQNNSKRLKDALEDAMRRTGKVKFKTRLFNFGIQKNGGALPVVLKVAPEELPKEMQVVTVRADNRKIAEYIERTGDISFAEFGERGEGLRIR